MNKKKTKKKVSKPTVKQLAGEITEALRSYRRSADIANEGESAAEAVRRIREEIELSSGGNADA